MSGHTHDDPDRLAFGCPACIAIVKADQHAARVADEGTEVTLEVEWIATAEKRGTAVVTLIGLPDETPEEIADRNFHIIDGQIRPDLECGGFVDVEIEWDDVRIRQEDNA